MSRVLHAERLARFPGIRPGNAGGIMRRMPETQGRTREEGKERVGADMKPAPGALPRFFLPLPGPFAIMIHLNFQE